MPLYIKLAHVSAMITAGDFTRAELLAGISTVDPLTGDYIVVNLKGRILKRDEVEAHLNGTLDGETVTA